ncbi:hypothetical protein HK102_000281 [Quaeritorhiza haematococci]|nr:hypothetical protein HK102_000281 [Quaeritorhiza haematococci]
MTILVVRWDPFTIFISYWTSTIGAYAAVHITGLFLFWLFRTRTKSQSAMGKQTSSVGEMMTPVGQDLPVVTKSSAIESGVTTDDVYSSDTKSPALGFPITRKPPTVDPESGQRKRDDSFGNLRRTSANGSFLSTDSALTAAIKKNYLSFKLLNLFFTSVSVGLCAIWSMHFIGMNAVKIYHLPDYYAGNETEALKSYDALHEYRVEIYFDLATTIVSALIAVLSVFFGFLFVTYSVGLLLEKDEKALVEKLDHIEDESKSPTSPPNVGSPEPGKSKRHFKGLKDRWSAMIARRREAERYVEKFTFWTLPLKNQLLFVFGGCVTGLGVAATHYVGMTSMRIQNTMMYYEPWVLALSIAIAMIVATVAMYLLFFLRGERWRISSAFLMGGAVCCMHYTLVAGNIEYVDLGQPRGPTQALDFSGFEAELLTSHISFTIELAILAWLDRAYQRKELE